MRRRRVAVWVVACVTAAACGQGDEPVRLAGAERLADPSGSQRVGVDEWEDIEWPLEDVPMSAASDLAPGDGRLYVLFDGVGGEEGIVAVSEAGEVVGSGLVTMTGAGLEPTGAAVVGARGEMADAVGADVYPHTFRWVDDSYPTALHWFTAGFEVGAMAFVHRTEMLVGSRSAGEIDIVTLDPVTGEISQRQLLGRPDDTGAAVRSDEDLGPIVAIAVLAQGFVAFVADHDGDRRLYLIVGDELEEVDTGGVHPVAAGEVDMDGEPRRDRWPMAPISASPDGRIVAVGEHEGHPRITLVDPESGDVEVLADLRGVEPTVEERVAAAIVGDDLFFLAEGSLWRKDGVVPG